MVDPLTVAIGVGLVVSLLFSELFGLAAGGMVVPGYFALALSSPISVVLTLLVSFVTWSIVRAISTIAIVYGRRRTVLMVLVGYIVGILARALASDFVAISQSSETYGQEAEVIGYIIPGLVAIWFDRQGFVETLSALVVASVSIRLVLILVGIEVLT